MLDRKNIQVIKYLLASKSYPGKVKQLSLPSKALAKDQKNGKLQVCLKAKIQENDLWRKAAGERIRTIA